MITAILTDPEARAGDDRIGSVAQRELRPSARAGSVHGQSSARPERHADRDQRQLITAAQNWARICSTRPACSATSRRSTAPRADCSGRSFRFIRRRPPPTAPTSSTPILYGALDKGTTVNLTPFVQQAGSTTSLAELHQLGFPAQLDVGQPGAGGDGCGERGDHADGQSAGRALRRADVGRISNHSVRGDRHMFSRRGFIRSRRGFGGIAGAASLRLAAGAGAERPELSRAGVRVPVRRQRFEQHRHPHGRRQLPGVHLDSRQPGADRPAS